MYVVSVYSVECIYYIRRKTYACTLDTYMIITVAT